MVYKPFYQITDWQNLPIQKTPINRTNLLHVENGIKEADNRIIHLDTEKLEKAEANLMVKSVVVDAKTGVITVTLLNGTVYTYDLDIERVVVNFDITDDNILILTLADGTKKRVDLTRFVYSFSNTATITMKMVNRKVTAEIVDGSVTMAKLDASIQSTFCNIFWMLSRLETLPCSTRKMQSDMLSVMLNLMEARQIMQNITVTNLKNIPKSHKKLPQ